MWKVQLRCDGCKGTELAFVDEGLSDAVRAVKRAASDAGWLFVRNKGWSCPNCRNPRTISVGNRVRYIGNITSAEFCSLKGSIARVVERREVIGVIHVIFEDPKTGRYSQQAHWFFEYEFEPVGEDKDASNTRDATHRAGSPDSSQLVEGCQEDNPTEHT